MTGVLARWFSRVTYTCHHCGVSQRIPLRRIHFFERFHELDHGEAVLILCPECRHGVQTPSEYRSHTGHTITVDPHNPPSNAVVHAHY